MRLLQAFREFRGPELSAWVELGQWGIRGVCVLVQEVFFAPVWIPAPLMSSVCPGPTVNLFLPTIDSPEDMDHISSSLCAQ